MTNSWRYFCVSNVSCLKYVWTSAAVWFVCLHSWKNRLLYSKLQCYFRTTKVEMIKFATVTSNCVGINLWKFCKKILKYSETGGICSRGCFYCHTLYICWVLMSVWSAQRVSVKQRLGVGHRPLRRLSAHERLGIRRHSNVQHSTVSRCMCTCIYQSVLSLLHSSTMCVCVWLLQR